MKLSILFTPLILAATTLGQATVIDLPQFGASLQHGETFTFKVTRPVSNILALLSIIPHETISGFLQASIQTSTEVGYAIGIAPCSSGNCIDPGSRFGQILYNGPFRPQRDGNPGPGPYQNFTLTIPTSESIPTGLAQINTARLHMIGVSAYAHIVRLRVLTDSLGGSCRYYGNQECTNPDRLIFWHMVERPRCSISSDRQLINNA
jgi:hypothetical protein